MRKFLTLLWVCPLACLLELFGPEIEYPDLNNDADRS